MTKAIRVTTARDEGLGAFGLFLMFLFPPAWIILIPLFLMHPNKAVRIGTALFLGTFIVFPAAYSIVTMDEVCNPETSMKIPENCIDGKYHWGHKG